MVRSYFVYLVDLVLFSILCAYSFFEHIVCMNILYAIKTCNDFFCREN